jgi:hypothetical protein
MTPMFTPEWEQQRKRELKRKRDHAAGLGFEVRNITYRSLVYMNPKTGAQMRTRPIPTRSSREMRDFVYEARRAGYVPCYITKVTLDV